jgi:hypothetical protein
MSLQDFLQYFEVIFVTIFFDDTWDKQTVKDSWGAGRAGGSTLYKDTVRFNPQYLVVAEADVETFFLLHQAAAFSRTGLPVCPDFVEVSTVGFEFYKFHGLLLGDPDNDSPELVGSGMSRDSPSM